MMVAEPGILAAPEAGPSSGPFHINSHSMIPNSGLAWPACSLWDLELDDGRPLQCVSCGSV